MGSLNNRGDRRERREKQERILEKLQLLCGLCASVVDCSEVQNQNGPNFRLARLLLVFWSLDHSDFEFVSGFVFRISCFSAPGPAATNPGRRRRSPLHPSAGFSLLSPLTFLLGTRLPSILTGSAPFSVPYSGHVARRSASQDIGGQRKAKVLFSGPYSFRMDFLRTENGNVEWSTLFAAVSYEQAGCEEKRADFLRNRVWKTRHVAFRNKNVALEQHGDQENLGTPYRFLDKLARCPRHVRLETCMVSPGFLRSRTSAGGSSGLRWRRRA